jgi:excisionase family DNA binding protein
MLPRALPGATRDLFGELADQVAHRVVQEIGETQHPDVMSAKTIARRLDCSESEVRKNIQEGRIIAVKFGSRGYRVPREEYEARLARWKAGGDFWD